MSQPFDFEKALKAHQSGQSLTATTGSFELATPRDRNGKFAPQLVKKHQTTLSDEIEHKSIRLFALMHLLGFAFCPRIRDLHDKKLFIKGKADQYPALQSLISTTSLNLKEIEIHWCEVLRLATSIKQGTVTASLMLKKLASYPKQNGLAKALRGIGRIERTLFMLDWFRDPALRRRVQAGLNKGEARKWARATAVYLYRIAWGGGGGVVRQRWCGAYSDTYRYRHAAGAGFQ
ncbi:hypothetical protein ESOG_04694 [Escherichia coli E101]|nr:hypothetical protein ESOG_04694 [Escherichia coli E101]